MGKGWDPPAWCREEGGSDSTLRNWTLEAQTSRRTHRPEGAHANHEVRLHTQRGANAARVGESPLPPGLARGWPWGHRPAAPEARVALARFGSAPMRSPGELTPRARVTPAASLGPVWWGPGPGSSVPASLSSPTRSGGVLRTRGWRTLRRTARTRATGGPRGSRARSAGDAAPQDRGSAGR